MSELIELVQRREVAVSALADATGTVSARKKELEAIDMEIGGVVSPSVAQARQMAGKDTGSVDVIVQGVMVKHNVPKAVVWDQAILATIKGKIVAAGDDPSPYITTDTETVYKVSEKVYKTLTGDVKALFDEARTLKPGKPEMKLEIRA